MDIAFTIRYCKKLSNLDVTRYRVFYDGAIYNIVFVDRMNYKKKCLKLKCKKARR